MAIQPLSVGEVEQIAHSLALRWFRQDEPLPEFSTRFPDRLESCLQQPFIEFSGLNPYPELIDKASILFYLMVKDHPFMNGNKRLAVTAMLVLLAKNDQWIDTDPFTLYELAKYVASSKPKDKEQILIRINTFLRLHLVNFR